jgi:small subunit ribosomal protein S20
MANHKSSEKRARQTIKKTARNTATRKTVKTAERKLTDALTAKAKDAQTTLSEFTSRIMKAVSKGALTKATASRRVARLAKRTHAVAPTK